MRSPVTRVLALLLPLALGAVHPAVAEDAKPEPKTAPEAGSEPKAKFESQLKINHIDTSKAPLIRVYASVLGKNVRPVSTDVITDVRLSRKPDGESPVELFSFVDGALTWPKDLEPEELAKREADAVKPELAFASALKEGAAIVVLAPGFQDLEYRAGVLGTTSRTAAALFAKKLGPANLLNVIWYNDYVHAYVYTQGHLNGLTPMTPDILESCRKWETDNLEFWGLTPEEIAAAKGEEAPAAPPEGPVANEARCGLHARYDNFADIIANPSLPYEGYWPQLFGLASPYKLCQEPSHPIKRTGMSAEGESQRVQAFELALEMLARDAKPGQPRILILTGDGRDGYIDAVADCGTKAGKDCDDDLEVVALEQRAAKTANWLDKRQAAEGRNKCVNDWKKKKEEEVTKAEQAAFVRKLPTWLALAKAANIRIYSVIHPTGTPASRERLELLAWRTGGTPRYAAAAEEVGAVSDALVEELNGQIVVTFADPTVTPKGDVSYVLEARAGKSRFKSEPFKVLIPPRFEPGAVAEVKALGEAKLGKGGFLAVAIAVALVVLLILLKLILKFAKGGEAAAGKAVKGGKGADKAKAKAIAAAKKAKEAQKKAKGG